MLALLVDTSAHPRAMCYKCYNESIPSHTRLALNEFQTSCYSDHKSVRIQPYLESLPDHIDGAPPRTPTNKGHGITFRPLKHDPEIPPRDLKDLCIDRRPIIPKQSRKIYHAYTYIMSTFITNPFHVSDQIHTNSSYSIHEYSHSNSSRYHVTLIPTSSLRSHAKFMPNPLFTIHESHHSSIFICLMHLTQYSNPSKH